MAEIDPSAVTWDDPVDPAQVKWDDAKRLANRGPNFAGQDPTQGMSTEEKLAAGAGKSVMDLWSGVKQIFGQESRADVDAQRKLDIPLMHTGAGLAGNIAGNVAMATIPAGLAADAAGAVGLGRTAAALGSVANPGTLGAAGASGAIQGALQPVGTQDSRLWNTVAGAGMGAAGNLAARGAAAAGSAISGQVETAANKAVSALQDAGVPLDAAQRTGSILLNRAKAMLSDNPLTAGAQADFQDMQNKAVTRAFLKTIGADGNAATPEVMGKAMNRTGRNVR